MFPVGGVEVMLLGAALSGLFLAALASTLTRRVGWVAAWSACGLVWSLIVIALVTLIPTDPNPGIVSAEGRLSSCSWDIGGPAPSSFWIFDGGQRLLNTVLFIPSGALLVLWASRWRTGIVLIPLGLGFLAAYSGAIEIIQLELARIDRACDVTDIIDNSTGALIGVGIGIGLVLALLLRPWRPAEHPHLER